MLLFESHVKKNIPKKDTFYKAAHTHTVYLFHCFYYLNIEFYFQKKPSSNTRRDLSFDYEVNAII